MLVRYAATKVALALLKPQFAVIIKQNFLIDVNEQFQVLTVTEITAAKYTLGIHNSIIPSWFWVISLKFMRLQKIL